MRLIDVQLAGSNAGKFTPRGSVQVDVGVTMQPGATTGSKEVQYMVITVTNSRLQVEGASDVLQSGSAQVETPHRDLEACFVPFRGIISDSSAGVPVSTGTDIAGNLKVVLLRMHCQCGSGG